MQTQEWTVSDIEDAQHLGIFEFQDSSEEWHNFQVYATKDRLVFGGHCNIGFLESGYLALEEGGSIDDALQELDADLQCYYNDGPQYVSRIICNERM